MSDREDTRYLKDLRDENDIRSIIFEDINDDYGKGEYGDFDVIMMKSNGYINATKLCQEARKQFKNWTPNSNSKELIEEISRLAGIPADGLIIVVKGGSSNIIRGTYVHPDLIAHIASWCSPKFAARVSKIVNEYHIKNAIAKKDEEIAKHKRKLKKSKKKIDEMKDDIKTLIDSNKKMMKSGKRNTKRLKFLVKTNKMLLKDNQKLLNGKEIAMSHLTVVSHDRVISTNNPSDNHMLIVIKNNDVKESDSELESDASDSEYEEITYEYKVLRVMKKNYNSAILLHSRLHPNMEITLKITYSPNSINLWNRIKETLGKGRKKKIDFHHNQFNLVGDYDEEDLIKDIKKIHNERIIYDIDGIDD